LPLLGSILGVNSFFHFIHIFPQAHVMLASDSMKPNATKAALQSLLAQQSLMVGSVTLSNGSTSDHYFDCKRVTLSSEGAALVGDVVLDAIQALPEQPVAIGGLTHGADPIIGAVMMRARERGLTIDGFYVRKEPKKHGTHNLIENAPHPGARVVVVDDVVTAGGSVLKALDGAEMAGCNVIGVVTLVDRLEGGADRIRKRVANYIPIYTLNDFRSDIERLKCRQDPTKSELLSPVASQ
jgi:orotate phosphoribosyltransferase